MKKQKAAALNKIIQSIPDHSYARDGQQMEPVSLVILGNKHSVRRIFGVNGWYEADHIGPVSLLKTIRAVFLNSSYHQGLMNPSYINGQNFQLAYERPTKSDSFKRRHHVRLWRLGRKNVWVGTTSYDRSIGLDKNDLPTHHISPTLSYEDAYLARSLGIFEPRLVKIGRPEKGKINTGDPYIWNGKALLIDLSDED